MGEITEIVIRILAIYGALYLGKRLVVFLLFTSDKVKRATITKLEAKNQAVKTRIGRGGLIP